VSPLPLAPLREGLARCILRDMASLGAGPVTNRVALAGATRRRALAVSCGVHALHDGCTDLLYVLLPLWQSEFGLGYAAIGMLRAVYVGLMAGLQVPASMAAQRTSNVLMLTVGTALAATGYLVAGASTGFVVLVLALAVGGIGSSTQHPIGSSVVAQVYDGAQSREAGFRPTFELPTTRSEPRFLLPTS